MCWCAVSVRRKMRELPKFMEYESMEAVVSAKETQLGIPQLTIVGIGAEAE